MSKLVNLLLAFLIVSLVPPPALGWGCTAHQVIQQIAFSRLRPEVAARFKKFGRSLKLGVNQYDELTMACFMDDAKSKPYYDFTRSWHFIDQPFTLDGSSLKGLQIPTPNVLTEILSITEEIKSRLNQTAMPSKVTDSDLAAYLVHLVGDAHQPLHCAILVSAQYPKGDLGGNRFQISAPRRTLHAYWDEAGGLFGSSSDFLPDFGKVSEKRIQELADKIVSANPESGLKVQDMDPAQWVKESYELARDTVYVGTKEGGSVSKEYQAKTQKICSERLAIAGYRLAALLNEIYASAKKVPSRR